MIKTISLGITLLMASSFGQDKPIVLNIRGGDGTGGLTSGRNNELSSFNDYSNAGNNRGWGEFADLLKEKGFDPQEIREGKLKAGCEVHITTPCSEPIDFAGMDLTKYSVLIMGSNNSRYTEEAVDVVMKYIEEGGGIIFISDGNFGRDFRDAPWSDQPFLDRFGLIINQDGGFYPLKRSDGDFLIPDHVLLKGVNEFNGEGVNPFSFDKKMDEIKVELLVKAKNQVRRNVNNDGSPVSKNDLGKGPLTPADEKDASLITAEYGEGRAIFIYDRNGFFNSGAITSSMIQVDNKQLVLNIMEWVKRKSPTSILKDSPLNTRLRKSEGENKVYNLKGQFFDFSFSDNLHTEPNRVLVIDKK